MRTCPPASRTPYDTGMVHVRLRRAPALFLLLLLAVAGLAGVLVPSEAGALRKASHKGWPKIDGMLLINKFDGNRPLDAREGRDPFGGQDPTYRCDAHHRNQACFIRAGACVPHERKTATCTTTPVMPFGSRKHHELLGGHGNDTIYGGDGGDVIWGDYKPDQWNRRALRQFDRITAGKGDDFIYASHGTNIIRTGGGRDIVHARYGFGRIYCESTMVTVNLSRRSKPRYTLYGCNRVTMRPVGTEPA